MAFGAFVPRPRDYGATGSAFAKAIRRDRFGVQRLQDLGISVVVSVNDFFGQLYDACAL